MEKEMRLSVAIRPRCLEFNLHMKNDKYYRLADYISDKNKNKYLYAKLTEPCLKSIKVVLSPFANESLKSKVENLLSKNDLQSFVQVKKKQIA